jgi:FHA domain-containing protein
MGAYVELWVNGARERIGLAGQAVTIGQAPTNDLPLPSDPAVSRLHAMLESLSSGWCVRDLNSRNGTFVNGQRTWGDRPIRSGDEIRVGRTTLVFRVDEPEAPSRATLGIDQAPELTRRERDVLLALCAPLASEDAFREPASIRSIAKVLFVTEGAVKQHLQRLYDKFGIHDGEQGRRRTRLANEAIQSGAVSMGEIRAWVAKLSPEESEA